MMVLYHHPLCPHSRFVRLLFHEFGIEADMREERAWDRRKEFLALNPAGTTPVVVDEVVGAVPGAAIIAEYLDETRGLALGDKRLLPEGVHDRVEVRRLCEWFHGKFFEEVAAPLVQEKVYKRFMPTDLGGGAPDMMAIRAARNNIRYHLRYIGWLLQRRSSLSGDALTMADLAAAAHLSCVDYLGDVPWEEDEMAKMWYARIKSRPSFRPLLSDRVAGILPASHYANLDF